MFIRAKKTGGKSHRKPHFKRAPVRAARGVHSTVSRGTVHLRKKQVQPTKTNHYPGWHDLDISFKNERASSDGQLYAPLDSASTVRFIAIILAIAAAMTLYVGHIHASQELLTSVQHLRHENMNLHLKNNRLKGTFDGITSPARVYARAKTLGLVEDAVYGPTIYIEH